MRCLGQGSGSYHDYASRSSRLSAVWDLLQQHGMLILAIFVTILSVSFSVVPSLSTCLHACPEAEVGRSKVVRLVELSKNVGRMNQTRPFIPHLNEKTRAPSESDADFLLNDASFERFRCRCYRRCAVMCFTGAMISGPLQHHKHENSRTSILDHTNTPVKQDRHWNEV